jgi:hypothetical protein
LEELPGTVEREQKTDLFKLKRALLVGYEMRVVLCCATHFCRGCAFRSGYL